MLKRVGMLAVAVVALALVAMLPPAPGEIRFADPVRACEPIDTASGPVYPAGATIFDSTDYVEHWLTGRAMCPRGFGSMHILVLRREDSTGRRVKSWHCVRNVEELDCPEAPRS